MIIKIFEGINKVAKFISTFTYMFLVWPMELCEYLYRKAKQRIYSNEDIGSEQIENAKDGAKALFFIFAVILTSLYCGVLAGVILYIIFILVY